MRSWHTILNSLNQNTVTQPKTVEQASRLEKVTYRGHHRSRFYFVLVFHISYTETRSAAARRLCNPVQSELAFRDNRKRDLLGERQRVWRTNICGSGCGKSSPLADYHVRKLHMKMLR